MKGSEGQQLRKLKYHQYTVHPTDPGATIAAADGPPAIARGAPMSTQPAGSMSSDNCKLFHILYPAPISVRQLLFSLARVHAS